MEVSAYQTKLALSNIEVYASLKLCQGRFIEDSLKNI